MLGSKPIRITSGYRNQVVNRAVGGVPNSDHLTGRAADFQCSGFGAPRDIARAIAASDYRSIRSSTNTTGGCISACRPKARRRGVRHSRRGRSA
ncbi:D-Ala-D-Ala carboxypeptidase family metallohydrolase [Burkholderia anthina]|uniref:D-Ala-D-Ala carboxypeptidase family metallohydrolase n=2 Tax=Burkholderia TaxID=32008 RepID=UPI001E46C463|nr:D-Ala-D-Ala carboxypeptidase family metallohydrolase [Burkholderia anthina]